MNASKYLSFKGLLLVATILPGPLILATPFVAVAQTEAVETCAIAPPALPVYAQPPMPEDGYIWTPGYWQYAQPAGYYWVPGTWILPPMVGVLWTPPYWGWSDGLYLFHVGYWGPHVGFYGGVNYGYGYGGSGFDGGRWEGGHFAYNRTVNNFGSVHIANAYRESVSVSNNSHVSYSGGTGGIRAEPTTGEREAEHETHSGVTALQTSHLAAAAAHPGLVAAHNNARPAIAATSRAGQFEGRGVVRPLANNRPAQAAHAAPQRTAQQAAPQRAAPRPQVARGAPHQEASHEGGRR